MIIRFYEGGRLVTRELFGEELFQTIRDRTTKDGSPKAEFAIFKGFSGFTKSEEGLYPWIMSTEDVDRMGDVVEQTWRLDSYKSNPVILWAHNHSIPAIGYAVEIGVDKALSGRIKFNPPEVDQFGASIAARIDHGTIRAGSVGFIPGVIEPIEEGKNGKTYIVGWRLSDNELLEFSICNVPANPMALGAEPPKKSKEIPPPAGGLKMFTRREETK